MTRITPPPPVLAPASVLETLTECEHRVLVLVAQGYSDDEIARRTFNSVRTIEQHIAGIRTKVRRKVPEADRKRSGRRICLALSAISLGLVHLPAPG